MRDYIKQPLKPRELIPLEDLHELYIEQNLSAEEIGKIFNISKHRVNNCVRKYGLKKNKEQLKEVRERLSIAKFGCICSLHTEEGRRKTDQTLLKRYGTTEFQKLAEVGNRRKQTCLERYGKENPMQVEEFQNKSRQTSKEKYGADCFVKSGLFKEKSKRTVREKYGVDNISQASEIKDKKLSTFNQNYVTEESRKALREKKENTMIQRFGAKTFAESEYCDWKALQEKRYKTMKKNNSFNHSSPENYLYSCLSEYFTVQREYKTEKYPYKCDFYIVELDLFIEYQGYVSHGGHAFNPNSAEDLQKLELWKYRSTELNFKGEPKKQYLNYINVWTVKDVEKRNCAKVNKLNWIEFFSLNDFNSWFLSLDKDTISHYNKEKRNKK